MPVIDDLIQALQRARIEARFDLPTRILYSTDSSIYQIEPLGVAFPKSLDELAGAVEIAASFDTPVLARGSGSSLAGQAIGRALILDCSRYLGQILEIDPERRTAWVEPGVILSSLNKSAATYRLQFGPDPASAERATLGGSIANNATGAHSILYGMAADHLVAADVVLSDGSLTIFKEISLERAQQLAGISEWEIDGKEAHYSLLTSLPLESSIYRTALAIRNYYADAIRAGWPRTWRRATGYNLNYLLPWTPSAPPGWGTQFNGEQSRILPYPPVSHDSINLAPLLAGSEGTLAVLRRALVRLVPLPEHTILGVIAFPGIAEACDVVPAILELMPSAVELIPGIMIQLARSVPAFARQLSFLDELRQNEAPPDLLVVEFSGNSVEQLIERVRMLRDVNGNSRQVLLAESTEAQKQVWAVRKVGLGLLSSRTGEVKSTAFIEDLSVPVERLGEFVRELQRIIAQHGTQADFYAHASAGCLHIRPMLNLKSIQGVSALRHIAEEAVRLTIRLGGAISGEHGIGLARSEWLGQMFSEEIIAVIKEIKTAADPKGLLNPGKILDSQRMDENLRYAAPYRTQIWKSNMDFANQGGLAGAIEMCNGAGVCRKLDGVMCPSYQATREEMHSTRGRANLLRTLIAQPPGASELPEINQAVYDALDLCLACKGCRAECPSSVDIAKLKYEFLDHYYRSHRHRVRDYIFAFIGTIARLGQPFSRIVNPLLCLTFTKHQAEKQFGISSRRQFPVLSSRSLHQLIHEFNRISDDYLGNSNILLLSDPFNEYMHPEVGMAAVRVLNAAGFSAKVLPVIGAGRTMISKGFLNAARRQAIHVCETIERLDPEGRLPILGLEPSEIYTLRDEYYDLLPGDPRVPGIAARAWMIDEFLLRPSEDGRPRLSLPLANKVNIGNPVYLHGHCYQKAQPPGPDGYPTGVAATRKLLELCNYRVKVVDSGCCGMAGAFGYESEHYDLSMQVGELALFPALREAIKDSEIEPIFAAAGVSCQAQIEDGTSRTALHPIQLVANLISK
jgi:FAD/FMN-containing dehydrogenase/Fe-S oxidoreductase